jgi:endonuclease YncB( thermonuclease family)
MADRCPWWPAAIAFAAGLAVGLNLGIGYAHAETIDGDRITIIDGDTIALPCDPLRGIYPRCSERIRLVGIDAPETGHRARCEAEQIAGITARTALFSLIRGHTIEITRTGRDRYGRTMAHLTSDGRSLVEASPVQMSLFG